MSTFNFRPDDPRLTAYALGELDPNERAEIEAMLAESSEARTALEEIRETIGLLSRELTFEPALTLTMTQRQAVEQAVSSDNGERLGVSPLCSAVQNTEGSRPSARRTLVSERVQSRFGWGAIARAATTVAAVTVASAGVLYLSRVFEHEESSFAKLDSSPASAEQELSFDSSRSQPRQAETAGLGSGASASAINSDLSQPATGESAASKTSESLSQITMPEPRRRAGEWSEPQAPIDAASMGAIVESSQNASFGDPVEGTPPSRRKLSDSMLAQSPSESSESSIAVEAGAATDSSRPVISVVDNLIGGPASDRISVPMNEDPIPANPEGAPAVSEDVLIVGSVEGDTLPTNSVDGISISTSGGASDVVMSSSEMRGENTVLESLDDLNVILNEVDEIQPRRADSSRLADVAIGGSGVPMQSDAKSMTTESKLSAESEALGESEARKSVASPESKLEELSVGMESQDRRKQALSDDREIGVQFSSPQNKVDLLAHESLSREQLIELRRKGLRIEGLTFESVDEFARGTEAYEPIVENAFLTPMEQPLSTLSIDVDTASYANMRRFIQQGQLPPANAVRIEELVNYFRYDYPEPADGSPFSVNIDVATCPWNPQNKLARVGLKAKSIAEDERPATNLVFLIDVSGSMAAENKLPLVKQALNVLVSKMGEDDQIAIVTYAGEAGLKLNSTSGSQRTVIQQAIDSLQSGGSTNGAAGINIAYDTAIQSFIKGGANRVILCTDGDFNVGVSDDNTLVEMIQEKAASGVFLSVFGFGMSNLKDAKLEKLADKGNGNYGYIDGLGEARKVFGEQLSGTLVTVAKDVKLQLEFNNSTVGAYRLIGYENRVLAAKDFDDDTKDAGEIGAGHTVTALYEIVPKAAWLAQAGLDPEKFDIVEKPTASDETKEAADGRLFTVKLRHKLPDAETSEKSQDYAAMNSDAQLSDSNVDFRFAAAVASFGMQLRESKFRGNWTLQNVLSMADASLSTDRNGERTEFTDLVRGVMRLKGDSITDPRLTTHETVAPATPAAELPTELSANDARIKATVDGKYRRLLKKIEVRSDVATYGEFRDYGHWEGTDYSGHSDLPAGYWVWVYPNWYIWGDMVETLEMKPATEPAKEQQNP